jgi:hypothetical protein
VEKNCVYKLKTMTRKPADEKQNFSLEIFNIIIAKNMKLRPPKVEKTRNKMRNKIPDRSGSS